MIGDGRPYLVALITLDPEEAPAFAARATFGYAHYALTLRLATASGVEAQMPEDSRQ